MDRLNPIHERAELESLRRENERLNRENRSLRAGKMAVRTKPMMARKTFEEHEIIQRRKQRILDHRLDMYLLESYPWYARFWLKATRLLIALVKTVTR